MLVRKLFREDLESLKSWQGEEAGTPSCIQSPSGALFPFFGGRVPFLNLTKRTRMPCFPISEYGYSLGGLPFRACFQTRPTRKNDFLHRPMTHPWYCTSLSFTALQPSLGSVSSSQSPGLGFRLFGLVRHQVRKVKTSNRSESHLQCKLSSFLTSKHVKDALALSKGSLSAAFGQATSYDLVDLSRLDEGLTLARTVFFLGRPYCAWLVTGQIRFLVVSPTWALSSSMQFSRTQTRR